jgi:hypothetical protein
MSHTAGTTCNIKERDHNRYLLVRLGSSLPTEADPIRPGPLHLLHPTSDPLAHAIHLRPARPQAAHPGTAPHIASNSTTLLPTTRTGASPH